MPRFYQPDLGSEPDSPFARDANNKLVRRGYWLDMNDLHLTRRKRCRRIRSSFNVRQRFGGNPMKSAIVANLPDEHFVIRVDGRVKSHHRRFLDALREGLQLRDQFPQHDIKVQSMQVGGELHFAMTG
jgi:hypothetical protein